MKHFTFRLSGDEKQRLCDHAAHHHWSMAQQLRDWISQPVDADSLQYEQKTRPVPIFFDIETGPLPDEVLDLVEPVHEPPKTLKDPEKIRQAVADKARKWRDKAALSPLTGEVLAIGVRKEGETTFLLGPEVQILKDFWNVFLSSQPAEWVGHNSSAFDIPFLVKRSWFHAIKMPPRVMGFRGPNYEKFTDTMVAWGCGAYGPEGRISLDNFAKYLGVGQKNGSGEHFAELYKVNREEALEYLENDLILTEKIFNKIKGEII